MKDKLLFKKMMQEEMKEGLRLSDFLSCIILLMELTRIVEFVILNQNQKVK